MLEEKIKLAVNKFKQNSGALAIDWISLIGIIAEVLIPLLQNCNNQSTAVARMKNPTFKDRIVLRLGLRNRIRDDRDSGIRFGLRSRVDKLVESLEEVANESSEGELHQLVVDAVE